MWLRCWVEWCVEEVCSVRERKKKNFGNVELRTVEKKEKKFECDNVNMMDVLDDDAMIALIGIVNSIKRRG